MKNVFRIFRNIKPKLITTFTLILIIPSISIGLLSYITAKDAVENEIMEGISDNINLLNTSIDNTIQLKIHDIETLSELITLKKYQGASYTELQDEFHQYIELHTEAANIYLGTDTGIFMQEPRVTMESNYDPRETDWYKEAMEKQGEAIISDPYISASTDKMVITIARTTKDHSGVLGIDITLSYLQKLTNEVQIGENGYALLLDEKKKFIADPNNTPGSEATEAFYDKFYKQEVGQFDYVLKGEDKKMSFVTNTTTGWKIGGNVVSAEISDTASPIFEKTLLVIFIAIIIGVVIILFIIKSILKPIRNLKEKAITVSKGDLTEHIIVQSKDEIGQLGQAFNDMQESLRILVQKVEKSAEQVASAAEELTASAEQTSGSTEQVAHSIQEVASSADIQTKGVDKNAQALDKVSEGVFQIADRSMKVSELSRHTAQQAEAGGKAVAHTVTQMNSIHESVMDSNTKIESLYERSKEVHSILAVITGIADQTNLLALNAAIEAARAGEHGKGFAVVADEVRKLAEQSQLSAREIQAIIQRIQQDIESSAEIMVRVTNDVQDGVIISNEAIEQFNLILQSTKEMTPQMEDVSATSQQMAAAVQTVTATANELATIAIGNAAISEEVAASSEQQLASMEEITTSAKSLSSMAEELREFISEFKY